MKKGLGCLLLGISIVILFLGNKSFLTGGFILEELNFSLINFIGVLMFVGGVILLATSKKGLEILAIPGGESRWRQLRLIAATKAKRYKKFDYYYELGGQDSEEDILLLGARVKKGDRITFDTFPLHFREYKELVKKGRRDGKFPKGVKLKNLEIYEDLKSKIYGIIGLLEEKIKTRPLGYVKNRKEKYLPKIKELVHKII